VDHRAGGAGRHPFRGQPGEAADAARATAGLSLGGFAVERVLVVERLAIAREFYAGITVDDQARARS